jgi:PilZ domain
MAQAQQTTRHRDHSEKRSFRRMTLNTDIEITMTESGKSYPALCLNLSGTGLMFRVKEQLPEGETCRTLIKSGTDHTQDLKATLKIVRCASNGPDGFVVGAEIVEFN